MISVAAIALLALFAFDEAPHARLEGTRLAAEETLQEIAPRSVCSVKPASLLIRGDSHVRGASATGEPGAYPGFADILDEIWGAKVQVEVEGAGGDTATMGLERWAEDSSEHTALLLIYGTNDAAPRGMLSDKRRVELGEFKASLSKLVEQGAKDPSQAIILAPPPGGSNALARRIAPYRAAAREVAVETGAAFLDPVTALRDCDNGPPLARDALHLNAAGHACLGKWLAEQLCPQNGT